MNTTFYRDWNTDCGCTSVLPVSCAPSTQCTSGCPTILDFTCVIYHKWNNAITQLDGLGLTNGATLELVIETIDEKIKASNVLGWSLACLRADNTINTLKQFGEAVDTKLCTLQTSITDIEDTAIDLTANDSSSIDFTTSGTLNHTLTAVAKLSSTAGNQLSILGDGLYAVPQTLSIDYVAKTLSITDGNTVSFASIICGVGGFLGNLAADPSAVDGQHWYRTDLGQFRIKLNGSVRTITIT